MFSTLIRIFAATVLVLPLASSCAEEAPSTSVAEKEAPASATEQEPPLAYVSLGDSLAVGVGASDPDERGYSPLYRALLEGETGREVRLTQLGVSGETSDSFINGPDPQLARAESALAENPGAVVTLSLGANDLLSSTDEDREEALARYSRNLDYILRALNGASDPAPRIAVLALYNPAPGSFTDVWAGRLNDEIRTVAEKNGASVAAGDRAFEGREAEYAHYARNPWDIHPTDAGYEALARAFAEA
ncbi:MAG: SGNH/GDSL hydrolase family protein [Actinomycetota bacterium]|nr:SGNH/GDSL hydrolase family protein [Actinomycetota bacterium]